MSPTLLALGAIVLWATLASLGVALGHVPPGPHQQLPARRLGAAHRGGDLGEVEVEDLAQHEHRIDDPDRANFPKTSQLVDDPSLELVIVGEADHERLNRSDSH